MAMTPKQFMEAVYEIAFGHDAYYRGFYPEEVIERLQEFSDGSNPILIEESYLQIEKLNENLKELSDINININSSNTARIQEMHITVGHILCEIVEQSSIGNN